MISIIPGVTEIGDEWVIYAGIAQSEKVGIDRPDRDYIVQNIAVLAAGEMAERLVTLGESHSAGKSNDMKRATSLAHQAILRYGLSEAWGTSAIPDKMSFAEYMTSLPEKKKELLDVETRKLVAEGQALARQYLEANFQNALIPLGNLLISKGKVEAEEMQAFYDRTPLSRQASTHKTSVLSSIKKWFGQGAAQSGSGLRRDFSSPDEVANIQEIVEARKREQFESVPLPEKLPVGTNAAYEQWSKSGASCADLLSKRAS
jgi:hypothetical protein